MSLIAGASRRLALLVAFAACLSPLRSAAQAPGKDAPPAQDGAKAAPAAKT